MVKKKKKLSNILIVITALLIIIMYGMFGNPTIYINNAKLKSSLSNVSQSTATLEKLVPFKWTTVFVFDPYTPLSIIQTATQSNSPALKESVSEGMTHVVFTKDGTVVSSICAYPQNVGYYIFFSGGANTSYPCPDGGYSRLDYGDNIEFTVNRKDNIVSLYAHLK